MILTTMLSIIIISMTMLTIIKMITLLIILISVSDKKNDDDLGGRGREVRSIGKLLQLKEELKEEKIKRGS